VERRRVAIVAVSVRAIFRTDPGYTDTTDAERQLALAVSRHPISARRSRALRFPVHSCLCADAGRILWGRDVRVRRYPRRQGAS